MRRKKSIRVVGAQQENAAAQQQHKHENSQQHQADHTANAALRRALRIKKGWKLINHSKGKTCTYHECECAQSNKHTL